ncbi:hypothetical protein [Chitinivorax sp. B]|uniref:hypothetical protein n=1 Tax=Chitinivorax sp. B TaxID=2502235 RepID=UPI0010F7EC5B|nr:hypothetical protein [Chitinivorax sp. B]
MQTQAVSPKSILAYQRPAETRHTTPAISSATRGIAVGEPVVISQDGRLLNMQDKLADLGPLVLPTRESVAKQMKDVREALMYRLREAGIPTNAKFILQEQFDGSLQAEGQNADKINQMLAMQPELANHLHDGMVQSSMLAVFEMAAAGTEAWYRLGNQATGAVAYQWLQLMQNSFKSIETAGSRLEWNGDALSSPAVAKMQEILAGAPVDLGFGVA